MKISELIKQLNQIKLGHGDLICEVHDGLDPSDPAPVRKLRIAKSASWNSPEIKIKGRVVYIEP